MKFLKNVVKQILVSAFGICLSVYGFTSCDSREDWFAKEGEGATFIIKSHKSAWWDDEEKYEFRTDTVNSDNYRVVEYNLKLKEVKYHDSYWGTIDCSYINYYSEAIKLDIEGIGGKVSRSHRDPNITITSDMPNPTFVKHDALGQNTYNFFQDGLPTTNNDTVAPVLNTAHVVMELEDAFRNTFYCHVKIKFLGDIAPEPVLEIKNVDGNPMERIFDLSKSFDRDGSVEKYEFCIDGEIVEYNRPTFDCDPNVAPAGKGAYGGTYITSTSLSEVKHAFQTKGEHIVLFRCMDNLGLWSQWGYMLVTI